MPSPPRHWPPAPSMTSPESHPATHDAGTSVLAACVRVHADTGLGMRDGPHAPGCGPCPARARRPADQEVRAGTGAVTMRDTCTCP